MDCKTIVITSKDVSNNDIEINIFHYTLFNFLDVKIFIENEITDIWNPNLGYSLDNIKKDIYNNIKEKTNMQKHGMCAEFFMHLILRDLGYNQKCLFSNLEERSMKKGFDGFYEYNNEFWIAESKCAITNAKHKDKIKEALDSIEEKINNTNGNDPWKNAISHINNRVKIDENQSLIKKVAALSQDYINNISHTSSEFNIIPTSTLFVNNQTNKEIKEEINDLIFTKKIKEMMILCIDNNVYDEFIKYLSGG